MSIAIFKNQAIFPYGASYILWVLPPLQDLWFANISPF
jgi:hypothetical protein